jgi:uncharacterized circularly permuted ATP-grasp superfamily protein
MIKITLPDGHYYDEMLTAQGEQRQHYNAWWQWFRNTDQFSIRQKKEQAELLFHRIGITFNVYGEDEGTERLIPLTACRVSFPPASGSGLTAAFASG